MFRIEALLGGGTKEIGIDFRDGNARDLLAEINSQGKSLASLEKVGTISGVPITLPIPRGHPSLRSWPNVFDLGRPLDWGYSTHETSLHFKEEPSLSGEGIVSVVIRKRFTDRSEDLVFSLDVVNAKIHLDVQITPDQLFRGSAEKLRGRKLKKLRDFIKEELPENPLYDSNRWVLAESLFGMTWSASQLTLPNLPPMV